jgi:hypothetical protein
MASNRTPSAQTLKEIHDITRPLAAIIKERSALIDQIERLRDDLITMTDDREVGRFRGEKTRLKKAWEQKVTLSVETEGVTLPVEKEELILPTEADWLEKAQQLSKTFAFHYEAGQRRAAHMIEYAQQEGFQLLDGVDNIDWFLQGWQARINHRLRFTDDRFILGLGTIVSKKEGVTPTIFFNRVSIADYTDWIEANALPD